MLWVELCAPKKDIEAIIAVPMHVTLNGNWIFAMSKLRYGCWGWQHSSMSGILLKRGNLGPEFTRTDRRQCKATGQ